MQKQLLLGVEAIAQGAIDSGISGVYAYPGTPSTEITEYIQNSKEAIARNVHRAWAANEKTAMESALGKGHFHHVVIELQSRIFSFTYEYSLPVENKNRQMVGFGKSRRQRSTIRIGVAEFQ